MGVYTLPLHRVSSSLAAGFEDHHADIWCAPTQVGKSFRKSFPNFLNDALLNLFKLNPLDVTHHDKIAEEFGVTQSYNDLLVFKKPQTDAHRYYLLVYAIQMQKSRMGWSFSWSQMEGNNRAGAIVHLLLSSCHDAKESTIKYNSLSKEWIGDNMATTKVKRELYLKNITLNEKTIEEMVEDMVKNKESMLSQSMQVVIWYGKPLETFKTLDISAENAASILRRYSRVVSRGKTNSSMPYESVEVSFALQSCVTLLKESSRKLESGEIPGYSNDVDNYVEFDPYGVEAPLPQDAILGTLPSVNSNKVCDIFESSEWKDFSTNPDRITLRRFAEAWQAGVAKRNSDTRKKVSLLVVDRKKAPPPFFLTDDTFGIIQGDRKKNTTMPKATKKKPIPVLSKKHTPLGCEEMNKIIFLTMIWIPLYRAKKSIRISDWDEYPDKEQCMLELQFVIESQVCTSSADKVEPTQNISMKYKDRIDEKEMTPIFETKSHWAGALFLAECMTAMMTDVKSKGDAVEKMNKFIDAVYKTSQDTASYKDYDWLGDIGMFSCV